MHDLYVFIKNSILTQFPESTILMEVPQGVTPNVFESTISINWSPPTLFQISNSQFAENPNALFISLFPIVYTDEKEQLDPINYIIQNKLTFRNDIAKSMHVVKTDIPDRYQLILVDFATQDADIIESIVTKGQIVGQLTSMLSIPDVGRPF